MQEKESIVAVRCELKIPSVGITEQLPSWRKFQNNMKKGSFGNIASKV